MVKKIAEYVLRFWKKIVKMVRRAELLHVITINLLENLKPGIYVGDPIPTPKFFFVNETTVFCPYCSYPGQHDHHVKKKDLYDHFKSKDHLNQFVHHHFPIVSNESLDKIRFVLNHLDPEKLEDYVGVHMDMLYLLTKNIYK